MKKERILLIGKITVVFLFIFIWAYSFLNEPIGDDILLQFKGAISHYLDKQTNIGDRITNPAQVFEELRDIYTHWSGRIVGHTVLGFGNLLPKFVRALVTALIFVSNILMALRIPYGNVGRVVRSPLAIIVLFFAIYWFRYGCYFEYMWTMVTLYSLPTLLILSYYNLTTMDIFRSNDRKDIIFVQFVGFLAGLSHELLSLLLIVIVGCEWIRDCILKKERLSAIFSHLGLGIGYLFCFFSPGNFYRARQSHDAVTSTYLERIDEVWDTQLFALMGTYEQKMILIVVLSLVFVSVVVMKKKQINVLFILIDRIGIIVAICLWTLLCAIVPRFAVYGEDLWIYLIYILGLCFVVKIPFEGELKSIIHGCFTIILLIIFLTTSYTEIRSCAATSHHRRQLVRQAVSEGMEEIAVPGFDKTLSADRYALSYLNNQSFYNEKFCVEYYGTRLIIQKD